MPGSYNNILVVRTDRIGDVVLTTPSIQALKEAFPEAEVSILISPQTKDIVDGNPYLNEIFIDDKAGENKGLLGFLKLVRVLRQREFDLAVIYHTKKRTNLLCFLAGIPERVGYKDKKFGFFLTRPLEDTRQLGKKHEIENCLDVVRSLGVEAHCKGLFIPQDTESDEWINQLLEQNSILPDRPLIVIHAGASDRTKRWPEECFVKLIDQIIEKYSANIILIGSADMRKISREIRTSVRMPVLDVTGMTTLKQSISLLRRSDMLISNDSGPVHLAAGVNTPVISIFTRNQPGINPERWKPFSDNAMVFSPPPDLKINFADPQKVELNQMIPLKVEEILSAVNSILEKR